jgi:tRNA nucleotidyltransferase/poly(A) polymerase
VVGGYVRNRLLGEPSADLDLVVPADGAAVSGRVAQAIGGRVVPLSRWRQWQVFHKTWRVDVSEAADMEEDLRRRDFTVNAVSWSLLPPTYDLFDPLGGLDDLAERRLELCRPDALIADPARLIRAARLVAYGYVPARALADRAEEATGGLANVPMERVWREWRRMAVGPQVQDAMRFITSTGVAQAWLGVEVSSGPWALTRVDAAGPRAAGSDRHAVDGRERGPGPAAVALALLAGVDVDRARWMGLARRLGCTRAEASAAHHRSRGPMVGSG